jgi:hypothetical protein
MFKKVATKKCSFKNLNNENNKMYKIRSHYQRVQLHNLQQLLQLI